MTAPNWRPAESHLAQDPVMAALIHAFGPCALRPEPRRTPFEALVRAIAHQQLSGAAAATILRRFLALFPADRFPQPAEVLALAPEALRAAGFSNGKVLALRDLAEKTLSGIVPTPTAIKKLGDEALIERLVAVRGVGRWTAEMLLMFTLGRPDILAADDFGLRSGYRYAYRVAQLPRPTELRAHGEGWRPYRSVACWYLWRAHEHRGIPG